MGVSAEAFGKNRPWATPFYVASLTEGEDMKKINTRAITLAATLTALCFVTGLLPYVFFLPVMVAATTLSLGMTAFVGLAFGAVSILYCFVMPMSPVALAFIEAPYIAIFPRILAAIGAFAVYRLIIKLAKPTKRGTRAVAVGAAAATGSLLNTAFVVGLFVLVMPSMQVGETTMLLYAPIMLISGAIEFACMAFITPPISLTLDRFVLNKSRKPKPVLAVNADVSGRDAKADPSQISDSADADTLGSADVIADGNSPDAAVQNSDVAATRRTDTADAT